MPSKTKEQILALLPETRTPSIRWPRDSETPGPKAVKARRRKLTDSRLYTLWRSDDIQIALQLGQSTRYFVLDIDKDSRYRNPETVQRLMALFEKRHCMLNVFESSASGGLHLLCLFDRRVKTTRLVRFIGPYLQRHGLELRRGQLEVFPSESTLKQALRLPFQRGFLRYRKS